MKKGIIIVLIFIIINVIGISCEKQYGSALLKTTSGHTTKELVSTINSVTRKGLTNSIKKYYKITKEKCNDYTLILYGKNKKIIEKITIPREPHVDILKKGILQITISVGSPAKYIHFYDTKTGKISDPYFNPRLIQNGKVVFMKDDKTLAISNIFSKKVFYKEIKRNFSPVAVPSNVILEAKLLKGNKLYIDYYKGEKMIEKKEIIDLDKY